MSLDYILNICYFGWILNFGLYILTVVLIIIKSYMDVDNINNNNNDFQLGFYHEQVYLKKNKNKRLIQRILNWVVPYYLALFCFIYIFYLLTNFKRNIVDIVIELDYIQDSYRIFKRH